MMLPRPYPTLLLLPLFALSSLSYADQILDIGCEMWSDKAKFVYDEIDVRRKQGSSEPVADTKESLGYSKLDAESLNAEYFRTVFDAVEAGRSREEVGILADKLCRNNPESVFDLS